MDININLILTNIVIFFKSFNSFLPSVDIFSGIIILVLSISTLFLIMKVIEKEIIFKWILVLLLIFSFFTLLFKVEIVDDIAVYTTSVELGVLILLLTTLFISWDEDSIEYN